MLISSNAIRSFAIFLMLSGLASCSEGPPEEEAGFAGLPHELASERSQIISDVHYGLRFVIPTDREAGVNGECLLQFSLKQKVESLVLDFRVPSEYLGSVTVNGEECLCPFSRGQITLPGERLRAGLNRLHITFRAGDVALNRRDDYLYSLFVPDRAATAFPGFDQPDLKAVFRLELEVPETWAAVSNSAVAAEETTEGRKSILFSETEPISTYLFAFAAGEFKVEEYTLLGRPVRMFHRESRDQMRVANLEAIFQLHRTALEWLEDYTGIRYPFSKFDFVVIPDFQFGGMEHPGAVFYKESRLFLEETATQDDLLGRASLIAHEVAHMWFGDLVTMTWFNDVWMKEVFANFFAAKIVNPSFPEVPHELRFFLEHYPAAYDIDRTLGTHPIRQNLDNLSEAASLYGAIIYQKAPIVMRQLEFLVGEEGFRKGIREYLERYSFANASWPDLIEIVDRHSEEDVASWSRAWVEEAGRPTITTAVDTVDDGTVRHLAVRQTDPFGRGQLWLQPLTVFLGDPQEGSYFSTWTRRTLNEIPGVQGLRYKGAILVNGKGWGYGLTVLDPKSQDFLLRELAHFQEPMIRAAGLVSLWEAVLEGAVEPSDFMELCLEMLGVERDELILQQLLTVIEITYWKFLDSRKHKELGERLETELWRRLGQAKTTTLRALFLQAFSRLAERDKAIEKLIALWEGNSKVEGLEIGELDRIDIAFELALRGVPEGEEILLMELEQQENLERKQRIEFLIPSVSPSIEERKQFFRSLSQAENRAYETWVLDGLRNLNHPLRANESIDLLEPGLGLLLEMEQTGSIFFPKRWLDSLLSGHRSQESAAIVRKFLEEHPSYPPRLVRQILQSADLLFRAADLGQED